MSAPTTVTSSDLLTIAGSVEDQVIEDRRMLHRNPETRYETTFTRNYIKMAIAILVENHNHPQVIIHQPRESKGGIVVDIDVVGATERILFRADFDALSNIKEATGLPFASQIEGKMHACGHDCHTAMLLGFLKCVARGGIVPTRNIRVVFQDAEENPLDQSGGHFLVHDEKVLEGVSEAHALHVWPEAPVGTYLSLPGGALGCSDRLKIVVKAPGGHVALPHKGTSAADVAVAICNFMMQWSSNHYNRNDPVSFALAAINTGSGTASNVRPAEAELWFAARHYFAEAERTALEAELRGRISKLVSVYPGATAEVKVIRGHPAMINSPKSYEETRTLLEAYGQRTFPIERMLGGEDFAHYLEGQGGVSGSMWMIGVSQPGCGGLHSPKFNPSEEAFQYGVLFWLLQATK